MRKWSLLLVVLIIMFGVFGCKKAISSEYNVDTASCNECGRCVQICPSDAIDYSSGGKAVIDQSKCTQCGNCVRICPKDAIY